jgi:hypothetical protein
MRMAGHRSRFNASDLILVGLIAFTLLLFALGDLPSVPPLPAAGWPAAEVAEPFARELMARVTPEELARTLMQRPELVPAILRNLGTAIMGAGADAVAAYLADAARASGGDVRAATRFIVVDPLRYGEDDAFRARIDALLPRAFARLPPATARAVLGELAQSGRLSFDAAEGAMVPAHPSGARRVPFDRRGVRLADDASAPIEASIFSLSSAFFTTAEAKALVDAVHAASPKRRIIVVGDPPMCGALRVECVDDLARPFTPWPRDPFIVARAGDGSLLFVNRPNAQRGREEDQNLARALVDRMPAAHWTVGPLPLHNGNILVMPDAVWISMHSVEPRALAILGEPRVPVETFSTRDGVKRYVDAVRRAAAELAAFYGKPVRFVHALPDTPAAMARLGGGAGTDLDSVVTILPTGTALVGDLTFGARLLRGAPQREWTAFRAAYGLDGDRARLLAAQDAPLQAFLDDVASALRRDGLRVRRLPLLRLPAAMVASGDVPADFLITWNNVVLEKRRAEGFASRLESGDRAAREAFAASGYTLVLFPPLIRSVVLGGGYRCASNHVR